MRRGAAALIAAGAALASSPACADPAADAARTAAPLPKGSDVASPGPAEQLVPAPAAAPVDPRGLEPEPAVPDTLGESLLPGRKRPGMGQAPLPDKVVQDNPGAVRAPPPEAFPVDEFPVPDRWRLVTALCPDSVYRGIQATCHSPFDPYHQSVLKGDRPLKHFPLGKGHDWFVVLSAVSDTVVEPRSFPTPVGVQTTDGPGSPDVFGRASSLLLSQTVTTGVSLIKGSTAYKPPEIEFRLTLAYNYNYAKVNERRILSVKPSAPTHRTDAFLGIQEAFLDYHLRNTSARYDFDSIRVGIQGFQADFRGFLLNDNMLGARLFGNRDDNRFQYNLAVFRRIEKDTNSGLNDLTQPLRKDYIFLANAYRQDLPVPGFTSQLTVIHNRNREAHDIQIDHNGFPVRPALLGDIRGRNYDVTYLGYNGDGHFGRIDLTVSAYAALGEDRNSFFTSRPAKIRAGFAAAELSYDINWIRLRLSGLIASGDSKPRDNKETGFDAILENPIFAGADTSYWIRQSVPFAGGGRAIGINGRNGILNDLRSSKDEGQSNFNNPGTMLLGIGGDFDLTNTLRVSANVNHLSFVATETLQALRNEGSIPREIGWDSSISAIWRPKMTQNIVFRASAAMLSAGKGFRDLFTQSNGSGRYYSVLLNTVVSF
jgi:hypothetical protein